MDMRELMIKQIKHYGWLDYSYTRGDYDAKSFADYESWLSHLSNEDLLMSYNSVREAEAQLD